ncbi:DNA-binding response regulator [Clostridium tetani]|uniref:Stage 0 sporulation protein A homolog n=1 Tax=Clostridium tetani TaxID=1513 RepID=A0A4Q0VFC0_CLOTA|nr:response regulator transcription factor [Clostridium tetani]RXI38089.1 DNA-binding response regulator [Clostridium tetani]RXI49362.1 DNA-binding response regulator [Clostridium tetani]
MKLLIVEDEKQLLESIAEGLRLSGYVVDIAENGKEAEEMCFVEDYDLVILDINLPLMDGFSVLKSIREHNKTVNIIMLTAKSDVEDRVLGLDLGANDYMIKPFHFEELEARIRSLLRRKTVQQDAVIVCGPIKFDTNSRTVQIHDENLKLTKKETTILEYLILNKSRIVSQEEILDHVWGDSVDFLSNTVRVHMSTLRRKLKDKASCNIIKNVIGEGYIIDE